MDRWLAEHLVCPRDHSGLRVDGGSLVCPSGHRYPYPDGIPIMLLDDARPTHVAFGQTFSEVASANVGADTPEGPEHPPDQVDPFVQRAVAGTCGYMYRGLIRRLTAYPIPDLPVPPGAEGTFLDIGCNWGRWCISAARRGYTAVGIDPDLAAVRAARRVAAQLGVPAIYVVADARHLPFRAGTFDVAFSYSVLQHFDKRDAGQAFGEIGRVLKRLGTSIIQMPNTFGLRNLYHQIRRGFRPPSAFEVRYWRPKELRGICGRLIGPTTLSVDGYFSLNPQASDHMLLPLRFRFVVYCSMRLRALRAHLPWLAYGADSLYATSVRTVDG